MNSSDLTLIIMQYLTKAQANQESVSIFQQLLEQTRDDIQNNNSKHKNRLPPILQPNNDFMLHLIREEHNTNKGITLTYQHSPK
jgi:hypothetical protein